MNTVKKYKDRIVKVYQGADETDDFFDVIQYRTGRVTAISYRPKRVVKNNQERWVSGSIKYIKSLYNKRLSEKFFSESGKIEKSIITEPNGDKTISQYDEKGRLKQVEKYLFPGHHKEVFLYENGQIKTAEITYQTGETRTIFYNEKGLRDHCTGVTAQGEKYKGVYWQNPLFNNLRTQVIDNPEYLHTLHFSQADRLLIEEKFYAQQDIKWRLYYDKNNRCTGKTKTFKFGSKKENRTEYYNANNVRTHFEGVSADNTYRLEGKCFPDGKMREVAYHYFSKDKTEILVFNIRGVKIGVKSYDKLGNKTIMRLDKNDKKKVMFLVHADGSTLLLKYNEKGMPYYGSGKLAYNEGVGYYRFYRNGRRKLKLKKYNSGKREFIHFDKQGVATHFTGILPDNLGTYKGTYQQDCRKEIIYEFATGEIKKVHCEAETGLPKSFEGVLPDNAGTYQGTYWDNGAVKSCTYQYAGQEPVSRHFDRTGQEMTQEALAEPSSNVSRDEMDRIKHVNSLPLSRLMEYVRNGYQNA